MAHNTQQQPYKHQQVVILDEAHERSLNTDILFGLAKALAALRAAARPRPLKLVVTSATLDGAKFAAYFGGCPVLTVPGRCFPVDIIHAREDPGRDYVGAAVDAVLQIHTRQPPGDILVFLTGQAEIERAVAAINAAVCALPEGSASDLLVLPLHASLPPELQLRVFRAGPPGARRCVVATNVAETSITGAARGGGGGGDWVVAAVAVVAHPFDSSTTAHAMVAHTHTYKHHHHQSSPPSCPSVEGVVYVVDAGVVKRKSYNPASGMDCLDVVPISRVQAAQRAGRAGRTRPGKCFRLYTKAYYEREMPDAAPPEIQRCSLAGAVLHLKALRLPLDVLSFDFLDRPSA